MITRLERSCNAQIHRVGDLRRQPARDQEHMTHGPPLLPTTPRHRGGSQPLPSSGQGIYDRYRPPIPHGSKVGGQIPRDVNGRMLYCLASALRGCCTTYLGVWFRRRSAVGDDCAHSDVPSSSSATWRGASTRPTHETSSWSFLKW